MLSRAVDYLMVHSWRTIVLHSLSTKSLTVAEPDVTLSNKQPRAHGLPLLGHTHALISLISIVQSWLWLPPPSLRLMEGGELGLTDRRPSSSR